MFMAVNVGGPNSISVFLTCGEDVFVVLCKGCHACMSVCVQRAMEEMWSDPIVLRCPRSKGFDIV